MIWILENHVFEADAIERMRQASSDSGNPVVLVDGLEPKIGQFVGAPVLFHGSLNLMRQIRSQFPDLVPGVFGTDENFDCRIYYPEFGDHMFNSDYVICDLRDVPFFVEKNRWNEFFIRPTSNLKQFAGTVVSCPLDRENISWRLIEDWGEYTTEPVEDGGSLDVLIAPVRDGWVKYEWRFVIADGDPIAMSAYTADGRTGHMWEFRDHPVMDYVHQVLVEVSYRPDPVFMLDIVSNGEDFRVMEIGCFSGCDLYECDRRVVASMVGNIAQRIFDEKNLIGG